MLLFKIRTLGCKVNQYETQLIREKLICAGYKEAGRDEQADLCIVNTCTVTAKADKESREALRRFIRENPKADIIAAGCYVEKDAKTLMAIDEKIRVLNNEDKQDSAKLLKGRDCRVAPYGVTRNHKKPDIKQGITCFNGCTKAFIKVQDGCNNFCSYCKIPYVRGGSRSRDLQEILREAGKLIDKGYKELVLTGICLGDFGKDLDDDITLAGLVKKVSGLKGDFRLRLSSIELPDVTDDLIDIVKISKKICSHFHIPLQSGDNSILQRMNRRYTAEEFTARINFIRSNMPGAGITTDVIIGFPGESDESFDNTLKTIRAIAPSRTHIFTYSPRKGTKAFDMKDTVSAEKRTERYNRLKSLTDSLSEEFLSASYKREHRVLVETTRDKDTGKLTGYTDEYARVLIDGPDDYMGRLIKGGTRSEL